MNIQLNNSESQDFLQLARLPAVLTDEQAGWLLGFTTEAIGQLVSKGHLEPLGEASQDDRNHFDRKRFSTAKILALQKDRKWLDDATDIIYQIRKPHEPHEVKP